MKSILVAGLFALGLVLAGCGSKDKELETAAPPTSDNATTFEAGGGQPKPTGEREGADGPQGPMEKPPGY